MPPIWPSLRPRIRLPRLGRAALRAGRAAQPRWDPRPWIALLAVGLLLPVAARAQNGSPQSRPPHSPIELPSNERLFLPLPGHPRQTNSFPTAIAVSPDGRYAAVLDNGYGSRQTHGRESIAIVDLATGRMHDYADPRLAARFKQTYFLGLAFGPRGRHLYASLASRTDPRGERRGDLGNGLLVYNCRDGWLTPDRFLPIPLQTLAPGHRTTDMGREVPPGEALPFPAGLAVFRASGRTRILVADNYSDNAVLLDAATGRVLRRYDLSMARTIPASFPYGVVVSPDGRTGYCSLWNASQIAVLDLAHGGVLARIPLLPPRSPLAPGSHPTAMLLSPGARRLYVTLSNRDRVAVINTATRRVTAWLMTKLPGQKYGGSVPNALAQTPDGRTLLVANAGTDSIAVFSLPAHPRGGILAAGFIPTEWYPTAVAITGGQLLIAAGKGVGTGPNATYPRHPTRGSFARLGYPYIGTLERGSIARLRLSRALARLPQLTAAVERSNLMNGRLPRLPFRAGRNPIRHVIYIIKENRTYDQILGDLGVGNGDPALAFYGAAITPNEHRLALRFGVLDNFYDSGAVSGNGHVWSTAATTTDYNEKTWQVGYRNGQRSYDYEGTVAGGIPRLEGIPDVDNPSTGFIWSDVARHGLTYRNYGEYIVSEWCDQRSGPTTPISHPTPDRCSRNYIRYGQPVPARLGGGRSPWPWPVPILRRDVASVPALVGHFDPHYADFKLTYPDQWRVDEFLREFRQFVADRRSGRGPRLPRFVLLRLPDDHTMGTYPGGPKPEASVADNDLAVGRVVQAISHSPYWGDTALFILEDDAQDGADHVDAHRSICLVVSKYAPGSPAHPFVDHRFYTTINVVRSIEVLLGLPPMNHNDARAAIMAPLFSGPGTQPAYDADYRNKTNGLIYQANLPNAPGARASLRMDWSHADANPAQALNKILWRERMGDKPMPAPKYA
ncbi:MAG: bifunctional YncE family protein/alkaline phosphatase family protein, partial [Terriglobales bacterium]